MRKVFLVLVALVAIAVMAAPALAGGKGKSAKAAKKPTGCKAVVAYVFEGNVASVGEASISLDVLEANKHGRSFGASVTMTVDAATKVVRDDEAVALADVQPGDAATLQARACKGASAATTLVARMIDATSPVVEEPLVEEPVL